VANDDAAIGEQVLNVAKTEVETEVEPHRVADDLGWGSVPAVRRRVGRRARHQMSLIADTRSTGQLHVRRRTEEGLSKKEILRCLKRYIARQLYRLLLLPVATPVTPSSTSA
jgi:hypothetical protein